MSTQRNPLAAAALARRFSRREVLAALAATPFLAASCAAQEYPKQEVPPADPYAPAPEPAAPSAQAGAEPQETPLASPAGSVNFIIPKDWQPLSGRFPEELAERMAGATLGFLSDHFGNKLPEWSQQPTRLELHKRLRSIAAWAISGVKAHQGIHPVDPVWIMAQIQQESFFYEFAVSSAFAVGVCQFIPETAKGYGMAVPADRPEHFAAPYALPELAGRYASWREARGRLSSIKAEHRSFENDEYLKDLLAAVLDGKRVEEARRVGDYRRQAKAAVGEVRGAWSDFSRYLKANFQGRDIFNPDDLAFLRGFDARVTHEASVPAMVRYMAEMLRRFRGNVIAATAAYNAGAGRVDAPEGLYRKYGRLPVINETVTYVYRIMLFYREISGRMA